VSPQKSLDPGSVLYSQGGAPNWLRHQRRFYWGL